MLPLQNTTQQPVARRPERPRDTPGTSSRIPGTAPNAATPTTRARRSLRLAQLRAQKAKLLGFPNYAAWKLDDQMAKTPEAAIKFLGCAGPAGHGQGGAGSQRHPGT